MIEGTGTVAKGAHSRTAFKALAALMAAVAACPGCFVTHANLTEKINEFDQYLQKREDRARTDDEVRRAATEAKIAELAKSLQALDLSVRGLKEEILSVNTNMGQTFESAEKVKDLSRQVETALSEIHAVETRLKRTVEALGGRMDLTLGKYREVLLEEKRVLMERLRALNESLRAMESGGNGSGD